MTVAPRLWPGVRRSLGVVPRGKLGGGHDVVLVEGERDRDALRAARGEGADRPRPSGPEPQRALPRPCAAPPPGDRADRLGPRGRADRPPAARSSSPTTRPSSTSTSVDGSRSSCAGSSTHVEGLFGWARRNGREAGSPARPLRQRVGRTAVASTTGSPWTAYRRVAPSVARPGGSHPLGRPCPSSGVRDHPCPALREAPVDTSLLGRAQRSRRSSGRKRSRDGPGRRGGPRRTSPSRPRPPSRSSGPRGSGSASGRAPRRSSAGSSARVILRIPLRFGRRPAMIARLRWPPRRTRTRATK